MTNPYFDTKLTVQMVVAGGLKFQVTWPDGHHINYVMPASGRASQEIKYHNSAWPIWRRVSKWRSDALRKLLASYGHTEAESGSAAAPRSQIKIERCWCGAKSCWRWWLVGVGSFVQGSGFDKAEAERIARALNSHDDLVAATKELLLLVDDLSRGVKGMALQNYRRLNEAPIAAEAALKKAKARVLVRTAKDRMRGKS